MKSSIKYIGIIDKFNDKHLLEFFDGVNVVTGRSSTGKSAIIEIFDYCFGMDENTIPHGVITDNAKCYFCIMSIESGFIVLARKENPKIAFIRYESTLPSLDRINAEYFSNDFFLTLEDFRKSLNNYFNLKVLDTDEDLDARNFRKNNAKAPCASVRHFVSFMLQHQNLIANKHALFYRFDEKEKRDQTIDQFKIFLGLVDQRYYLKRQKLADVERNLKKLKMQEDALEANARSVRSTLENLLGDYQYITGQKFVIDKVDEILSDPSNSLRKIESQTINVDDNSEEFERKYEEYKRKYEEIDFQIQQKNLELGRIQGNVEAGKKYQSSLSEITSCEKAKVSLFECPFCKNTNDAISQGANKLKSAIEWLNEELQKTPILTETFLVRQSELKRERDELKKNLQQRKKMITDLENVVEQVKNQKSRFEQALYVKAKIVAIIQDKLVGKNSELLEQIHACENEKEKIERFLLENYNVENKLKKAESSINENINAFGRKLDFEEAYKLANLVFSLETFDLHFNLEGNSVYLRSVGSGANWLACHISLFVGLLKYFCQQGDVCLIPPILFIDQPSQVYFPTSIDNGNEFDAKKLKGKEGKQNEADADLKSVTNLYQQLVDFCKETFKETGIMPQIIISDHADNLILKDCDFNSDLVKGRRWRKEGEGFIMRKVQEKDEGVNI